MIFQCNFVFIYLIMNEAHHPFIKIVFKILSVSDRGSLGLIQANEGGNHYKKYRGVS